MHEWKFSLYALKAEGNALSVEGNCAEKLPGLTSPGGGVISYTRLLMQPGARSTAHRSNRPDHWDGLY